MSVFVVQSISMYCSSCHHGITILQPRRQEQAPRPGGDTEWDKDINMANGCESMAICYFCYWSWDVFGRWRWLIFLCGVGWGGRAVSMGFLDGVFVPVVDGNRPWPGGKHRHNQSFFFFFYHRHKNLYRGMVDDFLDGENHWICRIGLVGLQFLWAAASKSTNGLVRTLQKLGRSSQTSEHVVVFINGGTPKWFLYNRKSSWNYGCKMGIPPF